MRHAPARLPLQHNTPAVPLYISVVSKGQRQRGYDGNQWMTRGHACAVESSVGAGRSGRRGKFVRDTGRWQHCRPYCCVVVQPATPRSTRCFSLSSLSLLPCPLSLLLSIGNWRQCEYYSVQNCIHFRRERKNYSYNHQHSCYVVKFHRAIKICWDVILRGATMTTKGFEGTGMGEGGNEKGLLSITVKHFRQTKRNPAYKYILDTPSVIHYLIINFLYFQNVF